MPVTYNPLETAEKLRHVVFPDNGKKVLLVNWAKVSTKDKSKLKYVNNPKNVESIENCYRYKEYVLESERNPENIFSINEKTYNLWTKAVSEFLNLKSVSRDKNEKINQNLLEEMVLINKEINKLSDKITISLTNEELIKFLERNLGKPPFDVPYQRAAKVLGGSWYNGVNDTTWGALSAGCNLWCPVCFVPNFCIRGKKSYATEFKLEDIINQFVNDGAKILRMTGGIWGLEPNALFLAKEMLDDKGVDYVIHYELDLFEPAVKEYENEFLSLGKDKRVEFIPCFKAIDKKDLPLMTGGVKPEFFEYTFDEFAEFWGRNITLTYIWSLIPGTKKERVEKFEKSFIPEIEKRFSSKETKKILQNLWMISIDAFDSGWNNMEFAFKRGYEVPEFTSGEREWNFDLNLSYEVLDDILRKYTEKGYLRQRINEGNY